MRILVSGPGQCSLLFEQSALPFAVCHRSMHSHWNHRECLIEEEMAHAQHPTIGEREIERESGQIQTNRQQQNVTSCRNNIERAHLAISVKWSSGYVQAIDCPKIA